MTRAKHMHQQVPCQGKVMCFSRSGSGCTGGALDGVNEQETPVLTIGVCNTPLYPSTGSLTFQTSVQATPVPQYPSAPHSPINVSITGQCLPVGYHIASKCARVPPSMKNFNLRQHCHASAPKSNPSTVPPTFQTSVQATPNSNSSPF